MSDQADYENTLAAFSALPMEDLTGCPMPIFDFIGEAEELLQRADNDFALLEKAGLERHWLNALAIRTGALRHAQGLWDSEFKARKDAQALWAEEAPKAEELRDDMLHNFRYALRRKEEILERIRRIAEGNSYRDMVQDLSSLSLLGKKYIAELQKVGFDVALLDTAASASADMGRLLAEANGDKQDGHSARVVRDQAYHYLKEAVDEVRDCGKFVFYKQPERLKHYTSDYYSQSNARK